MNINSKLIKRAAVVTVCVAAIAAITACASAAKPSEADRNEPDISAIAREDDQYIGGAVEDIDAGSMENIDFYDWEDIDAGDWEDIDLFDWEDWDTGDWDDIDFYDWEDWDTEDWEDIDSYDLADSEDSDDCWEDYAIDYGELTEAEIAELEGLYDRFFEIFDQAVGDLDEETILEMSDDEWNALFTPFEAELEEIFSRMEELEKKAGNAIAVQTEKMSSMVEDILSISRIESGALKLQKENADMSGLVENCLMPFEGVVASKQLDVELDLQTAYKNADADRLEHALGNLIGNAIKYASGRISISCDNKELKIWNDCEPLSREDLNHMFDRFYTGKKGSTGIGLALAKEIVELHGWSISADNMDDGLQVTIKY